MRVRRDFEFLCLNRSQMQDLHSSLNAILTAHVALLR